MGGTKQSCCCEGAVASKLQTNNYNSLMQPNFEQNWLFALKTASPNSLFCYQGHHGQYMYGSFLFGWNKEPTRGLYFIWIRRKSIGLSLLGCNMKKRPIYAGSTGHNNMQLSSYKLELTPQRPKTLVGEDKTDLVKLCPLCTCIDNCHIWICPGQWDNFM